MIVPGTNLESPANGGFMETAGIEPAQRSRHGLCECGCGQPTKLARWSSTYQGLVKGQPKRFIKGHNARRVALYTIDPTTACWLWNGATVRGYGSIRRDGKQWRAHRWMYEQMVGPIPEGLGLDHLCRVRACVNPEHLEPVTCRENLLRGETYAAENAAKTHCVRGHPLSGENLYIEPKGTRACKTCRREHVRRFRQRKREEAGGA